MVSSHLLTLSETFDVDNAAQAKISQSQFPQLPDWISSFVYSSSFLEV